MNTSNLGSFSLSIIPGCGSLHPLSYAWGGRLSDDDWTRQQSLSVTEYQQETFDSSLLIFVCFVWFYCRTLGYPVDSRPSRQCRAWALANGIGFKLNQTLVGDSLKFWTQLPQHILQTRCIGSWVGVQFSLSIAWRVQNVQMKCLCRCQLYPSSFKEPYEYGFSLTMRPHCQFLKSRLLYQHPPWFSRDLHGNPRP